MTDSSMDKRMDSRSDSRADSRSDSRADPRSDSRVSDGSASRPGSTRGSRSSGRASSLSESSIRRVCTFWLGRSLYALDVRVVRRILPIEGAVPVPRAHSAIVGLQIQRGMAVPLVNGAELLGLSESFDASQASVALLVEADGMNFGLTIGRVDAVLDVRKDALRRRTSESEPEAIAGVFDAIGDPPRAATLISTGALLHRVQQLRFSKNK